MNQNNEVITFAQAINQALAESMRKNEKVLCFGLGADDPKRMFGTTNDLVEEFGNERVFDMPTSENAMTGVAIGASLDGYIPVMTHLRLDFFLLAMDQLVNNAAKWHYTFNGQESVPITIRLIIGRGWGQGPTHSQALHAWFAHVPGLKVVMPSTPSDAKNLLMSSISDPNPVVFLEHRWLHNQVGAIEPANSEDVVGKAKVVKEGNDITIVAISYMTIEAVHATNLLEKYGINCELIDLRTISPIDWKTIKSSVKKTGRLLVCDIAQESFGTASEIISRISTDCFDDLKASPQKVASPDWPTPTSQSLSKDFYFGAKEIAEKVISTLEAQNKDEIDLSSLEKSETPHDVPGDWFKGPF